MHEYEYQIFIEELLYKVNQMGLSPSKMALRKLIEDFKSNQYGEDSSLWLDEDKLQKAEKKIKQLEDDLEKLNKNIQWRIK